MLSGQILTYKEWVGYEIPATLMRGALKIKCKQGGGLELFQVNDSVSSNLPFSY